MIDTSLKINITMEDSTPMVEISKLSHVNGGIQSDMVRMDLVSFFQEVFDIPPEVFKALEEKPESDDPPPPLPVCFRCTDNCDNCEDYRECSVHSSCEECSYERDCWEGKNEQGSFQLIEQPTFKPNRPACFNCQVPCKGCKIVDNPLYCLQCMKCNLCAECTVSLGKILYETLNR